VDLLRLRPPLECATTGVSPPWLTAERGSPTQKGELGEHVDVLVVGAGISGIGAAYHLQSKCPDRSYAILERRENVGGTWDLFRYPGIRSDSDMHTLGFRFRPWSEGKAIADGPAILRYLGDTAKAYGIDRKIRFGHRVVRAAWDSASARWTVEAERVATGETVRFTCNFLFMCSGYYDYDEGYSPQFPGRERFEGRIVHPQQWTDDIDYAGKRVIVIGSGATAVTLVPALARQAEHVTMLQRSPSYFISVPRVDAIAEALRRRLPASLAYKVVRWKNIAIAVGFFQVSRRFPGRIKKLLMDGVRRQLGPGFDVDTHFNPAYNPWQQRLCFVPDNDFFRAMKRGKASIVTEHIETFTERGILLRSGQELEADLIVTATGLNVVFLAGMDVTVDGEPIDIGKTMTYRALMFSGIPNLAVCFGYTNAPWTLKADLTAEFVCRVLNRMRKGGHRRCVPVLDDPSITPVPYAGLTSGYIRRALDRLPKQGDRAPWRLRENYPLDVLTLRFGTLDDGVLQFG
jgi:cation diffusion facilitator CzcD-associated flavoprotein CzcO